MIAMLKSADLQRKPVGLHQVISDQQNVVLITLEMSAQIVSEFLFDFLVLGVDAFHRKESGYP